ncbi:hypothetical protein F5887DRAFT_179735 [Amanita rubescens]|nr:hypothetical protein F5887DRAFT_179735 [Amanita rubescens]
MFSRRTNSKSLPSTEKKSLVSRFKPLFQRSKHTTPRNSYVMFQQPSSTGVYPPGVPALSSSASTPLAAQPPTPQSVYSAPHVGFTPTFSPGIDYLPFSPARPAVHLPIAGFQPTSRSGIAHREQWLDQRSPVLGLIPEHMPVAPGVHPPSKMPAQYWENSSSMKMSRESSSSRQAPHLGLRTIPSVSPGTVESSLYVPTQVAGRRHDTTRSADHVTLSGRQNEQDKQFWPPHRRSKPPSAEYLATPLSDNPLGLTGMVPPVYVYVEDGYLSLLIRLAVKATGRKRMM